MKLFLFIFSIIFLTSCVRDYDYIYNHRDQDDSSSTDYFNPIDIVMGGGTSQKDARFPVGNSANVENIQAFTPSKTGRGQKPVYCRVVVKGNGYPTSVCYDEKMP